MKKLVLAIAYTIPTIVLIVALAKPLTQMNNPALNLKSQPNCYIKNETSPSRKTTTYKIENDQNDTNLKQQSKSTSEIKKTKKETPDSTTTIKIPKESKSITNILLICTVPNNNALKNPPDKFSILSLDSAKKQISFIPIPLDISINIPEIGVKQLSDTYSWGDNTNLLLKALESKFNTKITKIIEINTKSLSEITHTLNELRIDMTEEKLLEYLNETKISKSMAETIKSIPIYKYPKLISYIKPYVKTNIDTASLIKYGIITYKIVSHG